MLYCLYTRCDLTHIFQRDQCFYHFSAQHISPKVLTFIKMLFDAKVRCPFMFFLSVRMFALDRWHGCHFCPVHFLWLSPEQCPQWGLCCLQLFGWYSEFFGGNLYESLLHSQCYFGWPITPQNLVTVSSVLFFFFFADNTFDSDLLESQSHIGANTLGFFSPWSHWLANGTQVRNKETQPTDAW